MADQWQQARLREILLKVMTLAELANLIFRFGSYRMHWREIDALRVKDMLDEARSCRRFMPIEPSAANSQK